MKSKKTGKTELERPGAAGMRRAAMDMIRKKAVVFLLWLLSKKEMHGYDIIKALESEPMLRISPKPAMVYPVLNGLCRKKLLCCRLLKEGKREKKIYRTTKKGREYVKMARKEYEKSGLLRQFIREMVL